ncbi:MAG: triose-phosphate isomerase [Nitrospinae bacterium]|nr:triose-phosphate isomerase [Nitrospinota bacterium]
MRRALVAGNWKMNKTIEDARTLARDVAGGVADENLSGVDVLLGPPYLALPAVAEVVSGSAIGVAGQDCSHHPDGAYTGEVSVSMLRNAGATHVILGHSERRELMGEGDGLIARKAAAASAGGLTPIICLGEPFTTRRAGTTLARIAHQMEHSIQGAFASPPPGGFILAYEPVWAIGTGLTATPEQAQEAHAFIRERLEAIFGLECAQETRILYGGSVKPDNAAELFAGPDIDGGLIGGASLKGGDFLEIIRAARVGAAST